MIKKHTNFKLGLNDEVIIFFKQYHKTKIQLPERFLPNKDLLDIHFKTFLSI